MNSEYDNGVYAEITSDTKNIEENYEVPKKTLPEKPRHYTEGNNSSSYSCSSTNKYCVLALTLTVVVLVLVVVAACIGFALEIAKLKPVQQSQLDNVTLQFQQALKEVTQEMQQLASFSNTSLQQLSEDLSTLESQLQIQSIFYPAPSCASLPPSSPSGYYWVSNSNGSAVRVYCDMTRSCGGVTGGWMRVAELDMTNSSHQCPSGLRQRTNSNLRTCVRNSSAVGCSSVMFSTSSINYTSVCGRVIAYQYGRPEAFHDTSIDSVYVEGVSLTHGSPRDHIWSFATAIDEVVSYSPAYSCPCINNNLVVRERANIPSFVGDDYFCDTGSQNAAAQNVFYSTDPLWDGAGCGSLSTCCSFNNPPWFFKQLPQPTTDDIEMRVCRDFYSYDEDIAIEIVDVYVR